MTDTLTLFQQDSSLSPVGTKDTGTIGERLAAQFLEQKGYRLVMANFTAPVGRNSKGVQVKGEIDLVALEGETLCFVEVKTRKSLDFGGPLTAVDNKKQRQITRTARVYRRIFQVFDLPHRFDVVTIVYNGKKEPVIELVRSFWTEAKFRKRTWAADTDNVGY